MGVPADPWRAGRARHHGGSVDGLADPQECRHRPGAPQGRPGLGGVPAIAGAGILALDFFTAGLLNGSKVYVLAVIEHGTRRIRILGATGHPVQAWVVQQARNLLMDLDDAGIQVKFVLHDRDASFTAAFDAVFRAAGVRVIRSAVQAPRMNSIMERWIGSCRRELLERTLIWNQRHLMTVLWRVARPFDPDVAVRIICWLPADDEVVIALIGSDKKAIGDVFYASAAVRGEALVDAWLRQKGNTDDRRR